MNSFKVLAIVPNNVPNELLSLSDQESELLKCSQFHAETVLAKGDPLLASSGQEFIVPGNIDPKMQRKLLQQRMGFNLAGIDGE